MELETMETLSTIPIKAQNDLVGKATAPPPPPFHFEKGLFEIEPHEAPQEPLPKISKMTERYQMRKLREIRINTQCQGGTGANVGATHDKRILWNYRILDAPIPVVTYSKDDSDGSSCEAIGIGQLKTISNDNSEMYWTMLHTPNSTGTILSPDKYMMDNPTVQSFKHEGQKNGTGSINFTDRTGKIIAAIAMKRQHDGLWYTTNPVLIPPLANDEERIFDEVNPSIRKLTPPLDDNCERIFD
jgi:hypothetical protein